MFTFGETAVRTCEGVTRRALLRVKCPLRRSNTYRKRIAPGTRDRNIKGMAEGVHAAQAHLRPPGGQARRQAERAQAGWDQPEKALREDATVERRFGR